ncbi:MAG: 6-bladed beta-propeller [bacterium]
MNANISWFDSHATCKGRWRWILAVLPLWVAGCQNPRLTELADLPCWPPPPGQPCVRLVRSAEAPPDFGVPPKLWQKTLNLLAGGNRGTEPWINPFGVCMAGDSTLYFTDTTRGEVVCVDRTKPALWRWNQIGTNRLVSPVGIACVSGLVYIADSGLGRVFIATPQGQPRGELKHPFQRPVAVAAWCGQLYVVDSKACRVQVFTETGKWIRDIGGGGSGIGEFNRPTHVAVDPRGMVYVTDSLNSRVQVFDDEGRFIRTIGSAGDSSGHFGRPKGVAVDGHGHVFVVDAIFGVVQIFDKSGTLLLDFGEPGEAQGQFWLPTGIAVNDSGLVVVADSYNHRLQLFQMLSPGLGADMKEEGQP